MGQIALQRHGLDSEHCRIVFETPARFVQSTDIDYADPALWAFSLVPGGLLLWRVQLPTDERKTGEVTGEVMKLLEILAPGPLGRVDAQSALQLQSQANFRDRYLSPALEAGLIERTIPDKPNSRLQKYRLTARGKALVGNR